MLLTALGFLATVVFLFRILRTLPLFDARRWRSSAMSTAFGKTVLITGATDGIGKAIARLMASRGVLRLVIAGRDLEKLNQLRYELKTESKGERGPIIETLKYDFSDTTNYEEMLCRAVRDVAPDSMINCAGISYPSALYYHELPLDFIHKMIDVNVLTPMVTACTLLRVRKTPASIGSLTFLGSASSTVNEPLLAAYVATKAAVTEFAKLIGQRPEAPPVQVQQPLMVSTKMSKIRKASFFVPSAATYAARCVDAIVWNAVFPNRDLITTSPYIPHLLLLICAALLPRFLVEKLRLSQQRVIRQRYLSKTKGEVVC